MYYFKDRDGRPKVWYVAGLFEHLVGGYDKGLPGIIGGLFEHFSFGVVMLLLLLLLLLLVRGDVPLGGVALGGVAQPAPIICFDNLVS